MNTTLLYQMFDMIAQSGVGHLGNASLILLQLMLSLFFETKFLYASMKKRPALVQLSVSMIPMVLIATYSIGCGLIFSAFLGVGPTRPEMMELINVTLSMRCIREMLLAAAVFWVLTLVYSIAYQLKPWQWLMTFGVETVAALALVILYGGLLIPRFPYTILDLCATDLYLARWPIYGYFTLLFKCCVLVVALFLGVLLRERKEKPEDEEEKYCDRQGYEERKTLRYLTKNHVAIGVPSLLFSVAAELFLWWRMLEEENTVWTLDVIFTAVLASVLFATPGILGVFLLYRVLRPKTCAAYRQLLAMGNREKVIRLFCEEVVNGGVPQTNWKTGNLQIRTAHFLLRQQGVRQWVEWRSGRLSDEGD